MTTLKKISSAIVRIIHTINEVIYSQNLLTAHMLALERRQKELEKKLNEINRH